MNTSHSYDRRRKVRSRLALAVIAFTALIAGSATAEARILNKTEDFAGTTLRYRVILPDGYNADAEYPAVLAFPGGGQTLPLVDSIIARNLRLQAEKRGYLVFALSAPSQGLFWQGGEIVFPEFLDKMLSEYKIRDRKFHIAGVSNGGISSFHIAASHPQYFVSVTGLPGYLPNESAARISALKGMCIHMYVGEEDTGWVGTMQAQAGKFKAAGIETTFSIEAGQGHVMRTLEGSGAARLFDNFDKARQGCR